MASREVCSLLSACEDYALLDVAAMGRYAQVGNAEHRVRRDGIDLQTIAFVEQHFGSDTVHSGGYSLRTPAKHSLLHSAHVEVVPTCLGELRFQVEQFSAAMDGRKAVVRRAVSEEYG